MLLSQYVVLAVVAFLVVYPLLLLVEASFQVSPRGAPASFGLDAWSTAFSTPGIRSALWNTLLLIVVLSSIFSVASCLAALRLRPRLHGSKARVERSRAVLGRKVGEVGPHVAQPKKIDRGVNPNRVCVPSCIEGATSRPHRPPATRQQEGAVSRATPFTITSPLISTFRSPTMQPST